jgi:hypothetical protein
VIAALLPCGSITGTTIGSGKAALFPFGKANIATPIAEPKRCFLAKVVADFQERLFIRYADQRLMPCGGTGCESFC